MGRSSRRPKICTYRISLAMPKDSPFPDLESQNLTQYPIPTVEEADELHCNMIFYNLVSGCSACQLTTNTWAS